MWESLTGTVHWVHGVNSRRMHHRSFAERALRDCRMIIAREEARRAGRRKVELATDRALTRVEVAPPRLGEVKAITRRIPATESLAFLQARADREWVRRVAIAGLPLFGTSVEA